MKLFPKPVGSTANRSFPDTIVEIASFCPVRSSRDIPSSNRNLRDSSRAESKLTTPLSTEFAMFLSRTNKTEELGSSRTNQKLRSWANEVFEKNNDLGQARFSSPNPVPYPFSCLSLTPLVELFFSLQSSTA